MHHDETIHEDIPRVRDWVKISKTYKNGRENESQNLKLGGPSNE